LKPGGKVPSNYKITRLPNYEFGLGLLLLDGLAGG
jgi:hypothetical protein